MSSRNKSFSHSRILLIKTSSFALIRSFPVLLSAQFVVAHRGMRLSAKTVPLRSQSANEAGPCGFPLTSQTQSLLPDKAFALVHCPFTHFIKALCRHRCPGRSAREQSSVTQQTDRGLQRAPCSSSQLKRRPEMRLPAGQRVSSEKSNSSAAQQTNTPACEPTHPGETPYTAIKTQQQSPPEHPT